MGDNDQFRIRIGATATNAGFVEIATADDGTEPIHVRQYTGVFGAIARTATLLDGSGNTSFPGSLSAGNISTAATANHIMLRDGSGDAFMRYGFASYFNMSHGVSGATSDTIFYSSTDDYIRKNNATGFRASLNVPTRTGGDASGTWSINVTGSAGSAGSVTNAATFNNGGSGDASGTTFNGSAARTISYNTVGAPSTTGTNASGTWGINITGNAVSFPTRYDGGVITNPQQYFGQSIGLRVAMTGFPVTWADTLWINGYAGGDVLSMCALHFSRQGTPRMWITTQQNTATSYGTAYEIPSLGYNSGNVGGLYAGIYYDSNNAAFYTDPASTSNMNTITAASITSSNGTAGLFISGSTVALLRQTGGSGAYMDFNSGGGASFIHMRNGSGFTNWLEGDGSSNVTMTGSSRSPIFYDSNNTAFYTDPASTSILNGLTVSGTITGSVSGKASTPSFPDDAISKDNMTTRTETGFYQSDSGTLAEGWPTNSGGWHHLISCTHSNDSNYYALQLASTFYSQELYFRNTNGSGSTGWSTIIHSGNYTNYVGSVAFNDLTNKASGSGTYTTSGDFRAPIFYDSNDTSYFVNPNGTSTMAAITLNATGAERQITWTFTGRNVYFFGRDSDDLVGLFDSVGSFSRFYTTTSGEMYVYSDLHAGSSSRAPIFYDSTNTAFYTDPAGTSILNGLTVGTGGSSSITMVDSDEGNRILHCNSNRIGFLSQAGGWGAWCADDGTWQTDLSMWAPIFYDNNNTGYYLDPATTSLALRTSGYWQQDSTTYAGEINGKIQFPTLLQ
jgi:hypothetical protein